VIHIKDPNKEVGNMREWMNNVSVELEAGGKNEKEMLEVKNTDIIDGIEGIPWIGY
jgi:hypothetical protein